MDLENKWVYRFSSGEEVRDIKLNSRDWIAFIGDPQNKENCIYLFQYPNYSGYFEEICLDANSFYKSKLLERRYTSFTMPSDKSINKIALLASEPQFQVFSYNSAFSGDLNYIYVFSFIDSETAYAFTAKSQKFFLINSGDSNGFPIPQGTYFLVSGDQVVAKLKGKNTSIVVSKDKPFMYVQTFENTIAYARSFNDVPKSPCVRVFYDPDGFKIYDDICYENLNGPIMIDQHHLPVQYIVFPNQYHTVSGVLITYDSKDSIVVKEEGKVQQLSGNQVSFMVLPPTTSKQAWIFYDPYFSKDSGHLVVNNSKYGTEHPIRSLIVGWETSLYLVNTIPPYDIKVYEPGSVKYDTEPISYYQAFYNKNDMLKYITDDDCIRLYNSCEGELIEVQEICTSDSTTYKNINLEHVKLIAFPSNPTFSNVMIYNKDSFDGQLLFRETTCLKGSKSPDQKITLMPKVPMHEVYLYDEYFYSGNKYVLGVNSIIEFDESYEKISMAFGQGAYIRLVNVKERSILKIDSNTPKFLTNGHYLSIQAGMSEVINNMSSCLWTFDGENYQDMRVLYGGNFYNQNVVSYKTQSLLFPTEESQSIQLVVLIDRKNSIIQTYENKPGMITVDHSTFGGAERILVIPPDWDQVLLARNADFGEFKAKLGPSSLVNLKTGKHYSFFNSLKRDLRIFVWPLLNSLKNDPKDAILHYNHEDYQIERSFTVGLTGLYGFVLGDETPINVLYDCIITFDDCQNQKNIQRFCMRSKSIDVNTFEIITAGEYLSVLLTTENTQFGISKKYEAISVDGIFYYESACIPIVNSTVQVNFIPK